VVFEKRSYRYRENLIQSKERSESIVAQALIQEGMIGKNPGAVNNENTCENNLVDCSGLLKYHPGKTQKDHEMESHAGGPEGEGDIYVWTSG